MYFQQQKCRANQHCSIFFRTKRRQCPKKFNSIYYQNKKDTCQGFQLVKKKPKQDPMIPISSLYRTIKQ
jgi:hypothetical protein